MKTSLTRVSPGVYRHERLGVEVQKTAMPDTSWELAGPDPDGSGVVLARTLGDARAFLQEIEVRVDRARALLMLGRAPRQERERRGLTVGALAAASGVRSAKLKELEAGRLDPELDLLLALAQALDIRHSAFVIRAEALDVGERSSVENAENALLALHRYLYPERYADVSTHEWSPDTIMGVVEILEQALADHPEAKLSLK